MYRCFVCRFNRSEVVKLLLERGANPLIGNESSSISPLHEAARRGFTEICILLLNDSRIKATTINYGHISPLHMACFGGDRATCELILKHGADVTYISKVTKNTPLHFAAWNGDEYNCKLLINAGNCSFSLTYMNHLLWFVLVSRTRSKQENHTILFSVLASQLVRGNTSRTCFSKCVPL